MSYKKRTPRRSRKRKTKKQTRTHRRLQKGAAEGAAPAEGAVPADVKWIGRLKLEKLLGLNYTSRVDFRDLDEMAEVAYAESNSAIEGIEARAEAPDKTPEEQEALAQDIKDAIVNIALVEYKLQTNHGFLRYIQSRLQGLATEEAQRIRYEIEGHGA